MNIRLTTRNDKMPGYYGIGNGSQTEADEQWDLLSPLSLADDTVDTVLAIRYLQYSPDLIQTMKEIYRICRHKAVVTILAPYAHNFRNIENPHYRSLFSELTPLYLTPSRELYVKELEEVFRYEPPLTNTWLPQQGMDMDFRLVKIHYFYTSNYDPADFDLEERVLFRRTCMNVVDEIYLHLIVVKKDITREELQDLAYHHVDEGWANELPKRHRSDNSQDLIVKREAEHTLEEADFPYKQISPSQAEAKTIEKKSAISRPRRTSRHTRASSRQKNQRLRRRSRWISKNKERKKR
ncbi:hypothetical protein Q5741_06505 [Paenibacillus sp. JX-17]|uniref:Methyltransferase type 11 domain-containing protein n=1 Tax=Paenibacillus lacisoli TaxID=3064525 RepID=A0ABT9CBN1_9BACL|nr:hypothetical protein [Paenibacillus sp. JX-17]MDO7906069.1 hypothetical protein [Paenibacillus sp. JX-17]